MMEEPDLRSLKKQCCVTVYDGTFRGHKCVKPVKVQCGGRWYCSVHDPVKVQAKRETKHARWEVEAAERRKVRLVEMAAPEMLALLRESQTSIGGDWRERRDAVIAKAEGQTSEASGSSS